MVILRTQNKITDFFKISAWASPFNGNNNCPINIKLKSSVGPICIHVGLFDTAFWHCLDRHE